MDRFVYVSHPNFSCSLQLKYAQTQHYRAVLFRQTMGPGGYSQYGGLQTANTIRSLHSVIGPRSRRDHAVCSPIVKNFPRDVGPPERVGFVDYPMKSHSNTNLFSPSYE
jgi:hypothetical protein